MTEDRRATVTHDRLGGAREPISRAAIAQRRAGLKQMRAGYTPKNLRQFIARFERDNARDMTPEQWGEWVDALPIPEFMAMCCMTPDQAAKALAGKDGDA